MRRFMLEYYNWTSHGENIVQDYFEAPMSLKYRRSQPQLAMLRVIIHSAVMNNIWIERRGWFLMQSGRVILLLLTKDDVDLEYCKFWGDTRYNKPSRGRDPHRKKSSYVVLRYLSTTPHLQGLYSSRATVEHMTWHATHQTENGLMCHPSDAEAWKHFDRMYPNFAEELRNV
ncbi:hypothetical protein Sango_2496300 [Sesamum angolense]|uniref:Uncharacterized protein n=1 Tax=Sesamum angolense TaxID=2727404 RepID=A0AAE1W3W2_9LAMI|nr:hypothetical protein Sango_2496300 [Sesamum angolense]